MEKELQYETKYDSTKIEQYDSGAQRSSNVGKGRYDLHPVEAKRRVAIKYQQGAELYGENNWTKGIKFSRLVDSAMRHLDQYISGDRSEDHLAAVVWNVNAIMHFEKYKPEMNDLPDYLKSTDYKIPEISSSPFAKICKDHPLECFNGPQVSCN